jgi:hypothetical protein
MRRRRFEHVSFRGVPARVRQPQLPQTQNLTGLDAETSRPAAVETGCACSATLRAPNLPLALAAGATETPMMLDQRPVLSLVSSAG